MAVAQVGCVPYAPNFGCCDDWGTMGIDLARRAEQLAWDTLRFLTGGQVGNCPTMVRPCRQACTACSSYYSASYPYYSRGLEWNGANPCHGVSGCSCGVVPEVVLPGNVAEVSSVMIDGAVLDASSYRILSGNRLVRTDGDTWPTCQDMTLADDATGAFAVTYVPGIKPNAAGLWAAGVLACEYAKACSGQSCRLPSSVRTISRQGVSMQFDDGMFSNGQTGIREVDAYVLSVNPHRIKRAPLVWSPDTPRYPTATL